MRKLVIMLTALMVACVFCGTSFAANEVQMTLTSPVIYKVGCEKAGSTTYVFDQSAQIAAGDWWYMDLPENITLCKSYDFVVAGQTGPGAAGSPEVCIFNTTYTSTRFNNGQFVTTAVAATTDGPMKPIAGSGVVGYVVAGNMAFLVKGTSGQRRVTIYALGQRDTNGGAAPTLTNDASSKMQLKIFDGLSHSLTTTVDANDTVILVDADSDGVYGELNGASADDVIGGDATVNATAGFPYVENTLCINATALAGQYVYTSYASKGDKFTFTGDSQIAHTGTASSIALAACKGETTDAISMTTLQGATCSFEYDHLTPTNGNFCTATFHNKLLIEATSGAFGDIDDKYYVELEITSPNDGVYFGGAPAVMAYKSTEDECDWTGAVGTAMGATWWYYEGATRTTTFTGTDNDCAVGSGQQVDYITQTNTMDLDDYDTIWVNMPAFYYTSAAIAAGEVVTVEVTLNRYPCGVIFTDTLDLGSFVTSCTNATTTTLYYPWLPGTAATGWWGGFVITNIGGTAGTATLTYSDSTGAQATYTTASVAAGAQWVNTAVTAADLTDVSGFDMSLNHSVTAVCAFNARGFAFTGNGGEGTGYLANGTNGAAVVNMW